MQEEHSRLRVHLLICSLLISSDPEPDIHLESTDAGENGTCEN